jgi:hypothetical protein
LRLAEWGSGVKLRGNNLELPMSAPSAMRHGGSRRLSFLQALSTAIDSGEK